MLFGICDILENCCSEKDIFSYAREQHFIFA